MAQEWLPKGRFPDGFCIRSTKDWRVWEVAEYFRYITDAGEFICVPKGFKTDLASVPRFFHRVINIWGAHGPAAVIHDYLYFRQDRTRAEADAIMYEVCRVCGVSLWQRSAMYLGVRVGGGPAWREHQKRKAQLETRP